MLFYNRNLLLYIQLFSKKVTHADPAQSLSHPIHASRSLPKRVLFLFMDFLVIPNKKCLLTRKTLLKGAFT